MYSMSTDGLDDLPGLRVGIAEGRLLGGDDGNTVGSTVGSGVGFDVTLRLLGDNVGLAFEGALTGNFEGGKLGEELGLAAAALLKTLFT